MRISLTGEGTAKILALLVLSLIVFRNTVSTVLGGFVGNLAIASFFLVLPTFIYILIQYRFKLSEVVSIFYVFYLLALVAAYPALADLGTPISAVVGFTNLASLFIFWLSIFKIPSSESLFRFSVKLFVALGFINAVGAIVQFFISENLFGLINHAIYSDSEKYQNVNLTRRAISFIASPQSLSLFLAFSLAVSLHLQMGKLYGGFVRGVIFTAGILTISKAFFVFLFVFLIFKFLNFRNIAYMLLGIAGGTLLVVGMGEHLNRVAQIAYYATNIKKYSAYTVWESSISYVWAFPDIVFGRGLGIFSRGGQQLGGYTLLHGSTESFFIQLLVEIGIFGLALFLLVTLIALRKLFYCDKTMFSCTLALCVVGLFTPAVYGYVCGLMLYFCLAYGVTR